MSTHIPISSDQNNWWQKGRLLYLKKLIKKYLNREDLEILEIGPGFGLNINQLSNFGELDVVEVEEFFRNHLEESSKLSINNIYENIFLVENREYDLIVLLDVLEHISEDELTTFVEKIYKLLKNDGIVIVSVPAYKSLFSRMDKNVGHFRRYSWKLLDEHLRINFKIIHKFGFNYFLLLVRFLQIKLFKNPKEELETSPILNSLLYIVLYIEYLLYILRIRPRFGLSFFAILVSKKVIV